MMFRRNELANTFHAGTTAITHTGNIADSDISVERNMLRIVTRPDCGTVTVSQNARRFTGGVSYVLYCQAKSDISFDLFMSIRVTSGQFKSVSKFVRASDSFVDVLVPAMLPNDVNQISMTVRVNNQAGTIVLRTPIIEKADTSDASLRFFDYDTAPLSLEAHHA